MATVAARSDDPKAFLTRAMTDETLDAKLRLDAAKALMPYVHQKVGEQALGKKEQREQAAKTAESGTAWAGLLQ